MMEIKRSRIPLLAAANSIPNGEKAVNEVISKLQTVCGVDFERVSSDQLRQVRSTYVDTGSSPAPGARRLIDVMISALEHSDRSAERASEPATTPRDAKAAPPEKPVTVVGRAKDALATIQASNAAQHARPFFHYTKSIAVTNLPNMTGHSKYHRLSPAGPVCAHLSTTNPPEVFLRRVGEDTSTKVPLSFGWGTLAFSPDGTRLLSVNKDSIEILDIANNAVTTAPGGDGPLWFTADGSAAILIGSQIEVRDPTTLAVKRQVPLGQDQKLFTASSHAEVAVFGRQTSFLYQKEEYEYEVRRLPDGEPVKLGIKGLVEGIELAGDDGHAFVATNDSLALVNLATGEVEQTLTMPEGACRIGGLAVSPDRKALVLSDDEKGLFVYSVQHPSRPPIEISSESSWFSDRLSNPGCPGLYFTQDGNWLLRAGVNSEAHLFKFG